MNAVDDEMLAELEEAFATVEADAGIVVLRIRSDQRVFCAGADLKLVGKRVGTAEGAAAMRRTVLAFHRVYDRLVSLSKVTIAEIEGPALGGGLELALACDIRIAAHQAKLGLPEARVGLLPGAGGTQRLTRLCGSGVAARVILTGDVLDGREAERLGLVQWSADIADFSALAEAVVSRTAGLSAEALAHCKSCISLANPISPEGVSAEIAGIEALMTTSSTKARVDAFLKR
jgi:enoyl-CoA hydratase/carnithine racemase